MLGNIRANTRIDHLKVGQIPTAVDSGSPLRMADVRVACRGGHAVDPADHLRLRGRGRPLLLLGQRARPHRNDWVTIGDTERTGVGLGFQPVPERKTVKNRVHLDLLVRDEPLETARARLEGLGAATQHSIMPDIEGNEFYLVPGSDAADG